MYISQFSQPLQSLVGRKSGGSHLKKSIARKNLLQESIAREGLGGFYRMAPNLEERRTGSFANGPIEIALNWGSRSSSLDSRARGPRRPERGRSAARPAAAAWAAVGRRRRFQISGWGRTMELGRSGRTLMMMRPPAAQLRGHRPTRGIEDQAGQTCHSCFFSPPEFWKRNPTVPTDLRSDSGWLPVTV